MDRERLGERIWELRVPMLRLAASILHDPHSAEDAVSQAAVNALSKAESLQREEAVKAWLMRITARCCYEQLRRSRREVAHEAPERLAEPPVYAQERGTLFELIARLPDGQRQALVLYYYEGFSTQEIARILGVPRTAVSMRLSRGRRLLEALLKQEKGAGEDEA